MDSLTDVRRVLEDIRPDEIEKMVERIFTTETSDTDGHMTDCSGSNLKNIQNMS